MSIFHVLTDLKFQSNLKTKKKRSLCSYSPHRSKNVAQQTLHFHTSFPYRPKFHRFFACDHQTPQGIRFSTRQGGFQSVFRSCINIFIWHPHVDIVNLIDDLSINTTSYAIGLSTGVSKRNSLVQNNSITTPSGATVAMGGNDNITIKDNVLNYTGTGIYGNKVLVLDDGSDKNFYLSCRNISGLEIMPAKQVNAYQVLTNDWLVVVKEAVGTLLEVFK